MTLKLWNINILNTKIIIKGFTKKQQLLFKSVQLQMT